MENHTVFNPDNDFGGMPMAMALAAIAKSGGKLKVHLPIESDEAAYHGWIFENPASSSPFGFWHAGFVLLDPNTGETWLTVSFVPNHLGGIDVIHSEVKSTKIRKLDIVQKVKSSGFSFGFFSMQKLEVKHYFKDWRTKVYSSKTTRMIRLDAAGNKVPVGSTERPELVMTEEGFTDSPVSVSSADHIYNKVTCDEMAQCHGEYFARIEEEFDDNGELTDVALLEESRTVTSDRNTLEKPGLYIKTGGQAGIPALNMMEVYLIKEDGQPQILSRNVCTQVTYDQYRKVVTRSSSGSGPFKKSKIKTRIRATSDSLNVCGDFDFSPGRYVPKMVKLV